MTIERSTHAAIKAAALEVGVSVSFVHADVGLGVRLKPVGTAYQVTNGYQAPGRGGAQLCVHGYEAFIEAVLERSPAAVVTTGEGTYVGLSDFDDRQDGEFERIQAKYAHQDCDCE